MSAWYVVNATYNDTSDAFNDTTYTEANATSSIFQNNETTLSSTELTENYTQTFDNITAFVAAITTIAMETTSSRRLSRTVSQNIGITISGLVIVAVILLNVCMFFMYRKAKKSTKKKQMNNGTDDYDSVTLYKVKKKTSLSHSAVTIKDSQSAFSLYWYGRRLSMNTGSRPSSTINMSQPSGSDTSSSRKSKSVSANQEYSFSRSSNDSIEQHEEDYCDAEIPTEAVPEEHDPIQETDGYFNVQDDHEVTPIEYTIALTHEDTYQLGENSGWYHDDDFSSRTEIRSPMPSRITQMNADVYQSLESLKSDIEQLVAQIDIGSYSSLESEGSGGEVTVMKDYMYPCSNVDKDACEQNTNQKVNSDEENYSESTERRPDIRQFLDKDCEYVNSSMKAHEMTMCEASLEVKAASGDMEEEDTL